MSSTTHTIIRRVGRRTEELTVELRQPLENYQAGDTLELQIDGTDRTFVVELACGDSDNGLLHVV